MDIRDTLKAIASNATVAILTVALCAMMPNAVAAQPLTVVAAGALKPGLQRVVALFPLADRYPIEIRYASSGEVVDSLRGPSPADVVVVGHQAFLDLAERDRLVIAKSRRDLAFLIPALVVPRGNPKGILGMSDLIKPGIRLALADPGSTCLGATSKEVLDKFPDREGIMANVVVQSHSCDATVREVADGHVDAVIGWHVLPDWAAGKVQLLRLPISEVPDARAVGAIGIRSKNSKGAKQFLEFLQSPTARRVLRERGFPTSVAERDEMAKSASFARAW